MYKNNTKSSIIHTSGIQKIQNGASSFACVCVCVLVLFFSAPLICVFSHTSLQESHKSALVSDLESKKGLHELLPIEKVR